MRNLIILIIVIIFSIEVKAQFSPRLITFDTVVTKTTNVKSFYIKNPTNKVIQIINARTLTGKFYFNFSPFTINPNDSVIVNVFFNTNHNITYRDFLIFENKGYNSSIINYALATAKYPEPIYAFTQGLFDEQLKTGLRTYTTTGYTNLGYNTARDKMFETIDKYLTNDTIECVYSGVKIKAVNRTEAQNQNFDTEHTYPQSFFNEYEPMRSDLYHLYPTYSVANNARSNYPFGIVVSNITWQMGGSKRGLDSLGTIVFEPRDVHKGNVARSLFYFCVKYNNITPGGFMTARQENVLRLWNNTDTVDWRERRRNDSIAKYQKVRNPFIDHPELVERILSTYSIANRTPVPKISASPYNIVFDTLAINDTISYYLAIMNYGTADLNITSANSSVPQFIVESVSSPISMGQIGYIKIKFKPTAINTTYNGTLTISNSDSTITVDMKGFSNNSVGIKQNTNEIPKETKLYQNYPNPFNPETNIKFQIKNNGNVSLKIYDLLGKEVEILVNEKLNAGVYEIPFSILQFSKNFIASGIYYYKLETNDFVQTKKLVILK